MSSGDFSEYPVCEEHILRHPVTWERLPPQVLMQALTGLACLTQLFLMARLIAELLTWSCFYFMNFSYLAFIPSIQFFRGATPRDWDVATRCDVGKGGALYLGTGSL